MAQRRQGRPTARGGWPRLSAYGVTVVSVNYRLAPGVTFPSQLHDVRAAVRWLRANEARHGGRSPKACPLAPSSALMALCAGVTETDAVVPPERLCVDQRPRHPRLIRRELDDLECAIWNAQRWLPEALVATGHKAET